MARILSTAALVAALTAGSASASDLRFNSFSNRFIPNELKIGSSGMKTLGAVVVGVGALYVFGRFLNNCGPFRCNS